MGATLTGTRISDTYDSLLKATDNGIITSSAKQITDGVGTNTPLYISTTRIGIGVSPTTTFQVAGNSKIGGDLTVTGDLLVEGTTTTVDTDTLSVKDPLIIVGNDNNTSDLVDLGFYGLYDTSGSQDLYAGLYRSASDTKFHLFKDLQEEPTTTVNTSGTGYAVASLVANLEGNVTGGTISGTTGTFSGNVNVNSNFIVTTGTPISGQPNGSNIIAKIDSSAGTDSGGLEIHTGDNNGDEPALLHTNYNGDEAFRISSLGHIISTGNGTFTGSLSASFFKGDVYANDGTSKILENGTDGTDATFTGDVTGDVTGNVTGGTISGTTGDFSGNVDIDGTLDVDDVISVEGSAFGRIEVGGPSGGYVDLKAPNSDDYDLRLITSVGGAELLSIDTLKFYTGATTDLAFTIDASQNATFENNVTIPETPTADTHAASKGYVDAAVEGQDTLAEILANGNTSGANDIIMADDQKINFGDDSDLQIYHDGSDSYIKDGGTGNLKVLTNSIEIKNAAGTKNLIVGEETTGVELYAYNNSTNALEKVFYTQDAGTGFPASFFEEQLYINSGTGSGSTFGSLQYYTEGSGSERGGINISGGNGTVGLRMFIGKAWIQSLPNAGALSNVVEFFPSNNPTTAIAKYQFTSGDAYFGNSSADVDVNIKGALDVTENATFGGDATFEGNVGIGTTTPTAPLHIDGGTNSEVLKIEADADPYIRWVESGTDVGFLQFKGGEAYLSNQSNGTFFFRTDNTNKMVITGGGNVGIGTTTPNQLFEISKDGSPVMRLNSSKTTNGAVGDSIGRIEWRGSNTAGNGAGIKAAIDTSATTTTQRDFNLLFKTSNNVGSGEPEIRMQINADGNVGIGTTSPSSFVSNGNKLVVGDGTVSQGITIYTDTSGFGTLYFADGTTGDEAYRGFLRYSHSLDSMLFYTGGATERMRIDSSGRVGINDTVSGNFTTNYDTKLLVGGEIIARSLTASASMISIGGDATSAFIKVGKQDGSQTARPFRIEVGTSEVMNIDSSGNVGIGTTLPGAKLDVIGETRISYAPSNQYRVRITNSDGNGRILVDGNTSSLIFGTSGVGVNATATERMRIDSSGNVGIGTATPVNGKLVLSSSQSNSSDYTWLLFDNQASGYGDWNMYKSGNNNLAFGYGTSNGGSYTNALTLAFGGNVGIGTTSPSRELDVENSADNAVISAVSSTTHIAGLVLGNTADDDKGGILYNNTSDYLYFLSNGSERMRLTSGGDLHVDGDVVAYSTTISDKRLKNNVKPLESSLDKVMNLKGVEYVWNNGSRKGQKDIGFIAQEVEDVIPEIVREKQVIFNKEEKYKTVDYEKITAVLVEAVKELKVEIEVLKNKPCACNNCNCK